MHAVRRRLVEEQARAAGVPLRTVPLPWPCTNEEYEARMRAAVAQAVAEGFTHVAFGDLFLEDVRRYREEQLAGTGLTPLFPIWGIPTDQLADADGRRRAARRSSPASTRSSSIDRLPAGSSIARCSPICPQASIDAASAANFIRSPRTGPMFNRPVDRQRRRGRRTRWVSSFADRILSASSA